MSEVKEKHVMSTVSQYDRDTQEFREWRDQRIKEENSIIIETLNAYGIHWMIFGGRLYAWDNWALPGGSYTGWVLIDGWNTDRLRTWLTNRQVSPIDQP